MSRKLSAIGIAVLTSAFVYAFVAAQPVPHGGLRSVTHNAEMTGSGTTSSPLGLKLTCGSGQVLAWDGDSWECTTAGGALSGLTNNTITKATSSTTIGNSSVTDNGTVVTVGSSLTSIAGLNTFQELNFTAGYTTAALAAGTTQNWDPGGTYASTTVINVQTNVAGSTLGGLLGKNQGDIVVLVNHGNGSGSRGVAPLILKHRDLSSLLANRFVMPDLTDIEIPYTGSIVLFYDGAATGWIPIAASVGGRFERMTVGDLGFKPTTATALAAGNNNDWEPTGWRTHTYVRTTVNTGAIVTGLKYYGVGTSGDPVTNGTYQSGFVKIIYNAGSVSFLVSCEDTNSAIENRIACASGNFNVGPKSMVVFIYDYTNARWRAVTNTAGTFGKLTISDNITDTLINGSTNDYNPTNFSDRGHMRLIPTGTSTLTGLVAQEAGAIRTITSYGANLVLSNQDALSTAANRFSLPGSTNITLNTYDSVVLRYDAINFRWFVIGKSIAGGGGITNSAGANVVMKSDGTNAVASTITDNGTTVSTALSTTFGDSGVDTHTFTGTLTAASDFAVNGNTSLGNALGDVVDVNGNLSKFGGDADGMVYISQYAVNGNYADDNDAGGLLLNQFGYQGGATRFRDLLIRNGKNATIASWTGSTGAFSTLGASSLGDASGDTLDVNGSLSKFGGAADGYTYLLEDEINFGYDQNAVYTGNVNYHGYAGASTQFRNLSIRDGKTAEVALFTGSDKSLTLRGPLTSTSGANTFGDLRGTVQVYTTPTGVQTVTLDANASVLRFNATVGVSLVGITGGVDGRILVLQNTGTANITVFEESASATAADRIKTDLNTGSGLLVNAKGMAIAVYNGTASRWQLAWMTGFNTPTSMTVNGALVTTTTATVTTNLTVNGNSTLGNADADAVTITGTMSATTAPSTFGEFRGVVTSPAQITANQNDYAGCTVDTKTCFVNGDAARTISGFTGGADGRELRVCNTGAFNLTIMHDDAASAAANRVTTLVTGSADMQLTANHGACIEMVYNGATSRWVQIGNTYTPSLIIASGLTVESSGASVNSLTVTSGGQTNQGRYTTTGTDPSVSTCGTSPTIVGSDTAGTVTIGTGTAASCTVTFTSAFANTPACTLGSQISTSDPLFFSAKSTTAFTITTAAGTNLASGKFDYICMGL